MQSGKKWRARPTSHSEAKDYAFREDRSLETFVREKRSLADPTKAHLPLVSMQSIIKYNQEYRPIFEAQNDLSYN